MGKFRAEIIIKQNIDNYDTIKFEFDAIEDLSTRTMATNNPTQPVFDVFANQGLLVLKDKDLTLYENAINGVFDNAYQFDVFLYKGDVLIASHIINQRPYYDFANKTLTLNLGNESDNFSNILYEGYKYGQTSGYSESIKNNILNNVFGGINNYFYNQEIDNEEENSDFYGKTLSIPYLPEMSCKEALKKTLEVQGCSLIQKPNTNKPHFYAINMVGKIKEIPKVYKLLPKHTRKTFVPNIILDNRFSNVAVNAIDVYMETANKQVLNLKKQIYNQDITTETTNYLKENKNLDVYDNSYNIFCFIGLKGLFTNYFYFNSNISIFNNLIETLEIKKEDNPLVTLICKKIKYKYKNTINATIKVYGGLVFNNTYVSDWGISSIDADYTKEDNWEYIEEELLDNAVIDVDTFTKTFYQAQSTPTLEVDYTHIKIPENTIEKTNDEYDLSAKILIGKRYYELSTTVKSIKGNTIIGPEDKIVEVELNQIVYEPQSVLISYNGIVKEIKFDKGLQLVTSEDNTNKLEIPKGNELIQTNLDGTIKNSSADFLQQELYDFYKNGIRTGDIDVIFSNYVSTDGTKTKNIDTPFEVGDYVIPCKDNQGTPIITKNTNILKYYLSGTTGTYSHEINGKTYYRVNTRIYIDYEIISVLTNKYKDIIVEYIKDENLKFLNIFLYHEKPSQKVEAQIEVLVKKFSTPVYKVVDCEIDLAGGAGLQRLKLMENPNMSLEDISSASEPIATMSLGEEMPLEMGNSENQSTLSNNDETSQEMSNYGLNDLINL